jgi:hypothetical protein
MNLQTAVKYVNQSGILLVFPQENKKEPPSLWSAFYPRTKMRWEWDESGDNRVGELWHLREKLSLSRKVVYNKWYRGKATLLSFEVLTALLRLMNPEMPNIQDLPFASREILDLLEEDSPLSTKQLKKLSGLQGRESESAYNRALRELWSRQLIVAYGEVDEGAFPSIAIGATKVIFEEQWSAACEMSERESEKILARFDPEASAFGKYIRSSQGKMRRMQSEDE